MWVSGDLEQDPRQLYQRAQLETKGSTMVSFWHLTSTGLVLVRDEGVQFAESGHQVTLILPY